MFDFYVHLKSFNIAHRLVRDHSLLLSGGVLNALRVGGSSRSKIVQLTKFGVSWERSVTPISLIVVSISSLNTVIFCSISSTEYLCDAAGGAGNIEKRKRNAEMCTDFG